MFAVSQEELVPAFARKKHKSGVPRFALK